MKITRKKAKDYTMATILTGDKDRIKIVMAKFVNRFINEKKRRKKTANS